jgi:hypothetical protein
MLLGNWRNYGRIEHHAAFEGIARLLGQDHLASARSIPADSVPVDDVWREVETCARALPSRP